MNSRDVSVSCSAQTMLLAEQLCAAGGRKSKAAQTAATSEEAHTALFPSVRRKRRYAPSFFLFQTMSKSLFGAVELAERLGATHPCRGRRPRRPAGGQCPPLRSSHDKVDVNSKNFPLGSFYYFKRNLFQFSATILVRALI